MEVTENKGSRKMIEVIEKVIREVIGKK